jgi:deazaflavin-dependent oxidoreductase (nitroreductase family)
MNASGSQPTSTSSRGSARVPSWVPYFNVIARPLLAAGVPMGPDVLITIRGRRSGQPRTTPITLCENAGRRGLISPFGEVSWVRNLRAAGHATLRVGRHREEVAAVELGPEDSAAFIRDVVAPRARRSWFGQWFVRNVDKIDIDHPEEAAHGRPVFELHPR